LQKEQRLHGITCFITNLSKDQSSARDIIRWYRRKNKVEEAFHEIKSHLQLRPIHLTREKRVRAHVTICMLAYFFYNDIELRLKEMGVDLSPLEVLEIMAKCQINKLEFQSNYQPK
jgi:transposase